VTALPWIDLSLGVFPVVLVPLLCNYIQLKHSCFFFVWQCNKKHILECEEFSTTGKCSKGSNCKLMHRARKPAVARKRKSSSKEENESSKLSKLDFTSDEGFLPLSASDAGLS